MKIARATGAQSDAPRLHSDFLQLLQEEYLREHPGGRKPLLVHHLAFSLGWKLCEVATGIGISRGHCSRLFRQASDRLERIRREKFKEVARYESAHSEGDED